MKKIAELLNSLLSTPADTAALLQGKNAVAPKGSQTTGNNFGDVLAQLAAQNAGSNQGGGTPQNQPATDGNRVAVNPRNGGLTAAAVTSGTPSGQATGASFSLSETTIAITESVKVDNLKQLAQAEQALVSLATGLAQVLQMLSGLQQQQPQQAQAVLSSLGGLQLAPSDLQNLLTTLQPLVQKLPAEQNPLLLTPDQQANLLNQMFQQMIQAQQILLGVAPTNNGNTGNAAASNTGIAAGQNVTLNLLFSNTNLSETVQNNTQASQVFINLETFKMSATFIQAGNNTAGEQNAGQGTGIQFQPITPVNSQALVNSLNQALANLNPPPALASSPVAASTQANTTAFNAMQDNLNQNFKALVQLLMQSGVTQAALTTFLNNRQKGMENPNTANVPQNTVQTVSANPLTQVNPVPAEITQVLPPELTAASSNNINANQPKLPGEANLLVSQVTAQAAVTVVAQSTNQTQVAPAPVTAQIPPSAPSAAVNPALIIPASVPAATLPTNPAVHLQVAGAVPVVQNQELIAGPSNPPQNPPAQPTLAVPVQQVLVGGAPVINAREAAILNDMVSRLNAVALHATQGSLTFGSSAQTTNPTITLNQVTAAIAATQLTAAAPPVLSGSPSVPQNVQVPSPQQLQLDHVVNAEIAAAATRVETSQPAPGSPSPTTGNQTIPIPPTVSSNSVVSQAVINQAAPPSLPAPANTPLLNLPQNNGVVVPAASLTTPIPSTPPAFSPPGTTPVNGNNAANPPVPAAPATGAPATIVALPQPASLPATPTTPTTTNNVIPAALPAFAAASLNQAVVPAPTSQAPIVPATVAVGEAIKTEIPPLAVARNENVNNQTAVANAQPLSEVLPVSPEAVAPSPSVSSTSIDSKTLNVLDKNAPNDSAVLAANALLTAANATPDKSHGPLSSPVLSTALPTGSIDSARVLNQVLQQVAAQASEAKTISRLNFQLFPENLGRVTIQIALVDQSVSARILVTNPDVREVLQTHMVDLKTALNQAGLQIDQLQVQVQGGGGNLLAQYYQYQQEGFGYRLPVSPAVPEVTGAQNIENTGDLAAVSTRLSLVDFLA